MFNNTSRYLDTIFTIDNPEFEEPILGIYSMQHQFKANTSDKETSFLDLNIKVMAVTFITSLTTNAMTSDFISSISLG